MMLILYYFVCNNVIMYLLLFVQFCIIFNSCITLRYTAPVDCLFLRRDKMPYIGKRLVQVLLDKSLGEHPIFFHIFSNGGAFLYEYVSVAMQQAGSPFQVIF